MPKRLPVSKKTYSDIHHTNTRQSHFTQNSLRNTSHKYRTVPLHTKLTPIYITQIPDSPPSHKTHSDIHHTNTGQFPFTQNSLRYISHNTGQFPFTQYSLRYTTHKYRTVPPSQKLTPIYITQIPDSPAFTQNSLRYTSHKYRTVPPSHKLTPIYMGHFKSSAHCACAASRMTQSF